MGTILKLTIYIYNFFSFSYYKIFVNIQHLYVLNMTWKLGPKICRKT